MLHISLKFLFLFVLIGSTFKYVHSSDNGSYHSGVSSVPLYEQTQNSSSTSTVETSNTSEIRTSSEDSSSTLSENDVVIVTSDGTNSKENDTTKYQLEKYDYGFHYKFNQGAQCLGVKAKNNSIWAYDSNNNIYPENIYFDTLLNVIFLRFPNDIYYCYGYSQGQSQLVKEQKLDGFNKSDFELIFENGSSLHGNDKYIFQDYGYGFDFIIKNGNKLIKLKYKNNELWPVKTGAESSESPLKISLNKFTNILFVNFNKFYLTYKYEDNEWKFHEKTDKKELSDNNFKFFTKDSSGNISDDSSTYEKTPSNGKSFLIKPKNGYNFVEVKYENEMVWNHTKNSNDKNNPYKILLKLNDNCVWVYFKFYDFNVYKYVGNRWKLVFSLETGQQ